MNNKYINPSLMNFRLFHRSPHLTGFCIIKLVSFSQFKISPFPSLKKTHMIVINSFCACIWNKKRTCLVGKCNIQNYIFFHKVPFNCIWNCAIFLKKYNILVQYMYIINKIIKKQSKLRHNCIK